MSNPDTTRIFNYPEVTTPASDAKILLDSQTVGSKCIDANLFRCDLIDKTITQRGTFEASEDDADGFKKVVVDIPYTDVHVASGPIATFEGEDLPLKSLTASIVPVQGGSGDPSPTNVRPISGWTGEEVTACQDNLFDNVLSHIKVANDNNLRWAKRFDKVGTYYLQSFNSGVSGYVYGRKQLANGTFDNATIYLQHGTTLDGLKTVTITDGEAFVVYNASDNNEETSMIILAKVNVSLRDDLTDYVPYAGTTTTIPFTDSQGNPVEVFGGSVDVVNGSLTGDSKCYEDLSNITFELSANGNYYWSRSTTIPYALNLTDGMCSHFKFGSSNDVWCGINDSTGRYILFIKANVDSALGISSVAEFNTWLANQSTNGTPVQLWYKLATPNTPIQQQPTSIKSLDGDNNMFASTGDVDVEYQTVWVRPTE